MQVFYSIPVISNTAFCTIFKLSPYLSAHFAKHCWSEEESDDDGLVIHILKHLSLTVYIEQEKMELCKSKNWTTAGRRNYSFD